MILAGAIRPLSPLLLYRAQSVMLAICLVLIVVDTTLLFVLFAATDPGSASPFEWLQRRSVSSPPVGGAPSADQSCPTHAWLLAQQVIVCGIILFVHFAHMVRRWSNVDKHLACVLDSRGCDEAAVVDSEDEEMPFTEEEEEEEHDDDDDAEGTDADVDSDADTRQEVLSSSSTDKKDVRRNPVMRLVLLAAAVALLTYSAVWISALESQLLRASPVCSHTVPLHLSWWLRAVAMTNGAVLVLPWLVSVLLMGRSFLARQQLERGGTREQRTRDEHA